MITKKCKNCGKKFKIYKCWVKKGGGKFCSISCKNTGKYNPRWNGGKTITVDGYLAILSPQHPYADNDNYVLEHRLVMERHIKRFLLPTEIVHHINEIRDDNRIENLLLTNKSAHKTLHLKLYWQRKKQSKS